METFNKITEEEEAELKVMTSEMYRDGGWTNVLACINTLQKVQIIILTKLNEILEEERKR